MQLSLGLVGNFSGSNVLDFAYDLVLSGLKCLL